MFCLRDYISLLLTEALQRTCNNIWSQSYSQLWEIGIFDVLNNIKMTVKTYIWLILVDRHIEEDYLWKERYLCIVKFLILCSPYSWLQFLHSKIISSTRNYYTTLWFVSSSLWQQMKAPLVQLQCPTETQPLRIYVLKSLISLKNFLKLKS